MKEQKYRDIHLYKQLHKESAGYGAFCHSYITLIKKYIQDTNSSNILDFGCGKGNLKRALSSHGIVIDEYDPAISGKDVLPSKEYDLVITTDVLEHLHPDEIDIIKDEFENLNPKHMMHIISTRTAVQILPDGTNAHKTVQPGDWWLNSLDSKGYTSRVDVNPSYIRVGEISIVFMTRNNVA
jgi:2-polyprenyl-3-methyl-5-hydroxy-6-metoxy-1,4-benzoquinol methylase